LPLDNGIRSAALVGAVEGGRPVTFPVVHPTSAHGVESGFVGEGG
jgi:hypothetical protein